MSVNELVSDIQIDLGFDVGKMAPVIKRWAYQAVKSMGVAYINKKTKVYTDLTSNPEKPDDYVQADRIFFVTADGGCTEPYNAQQFCCSLTQPLENQFFALGSCSPSWTIDETITHFVFSSDVKNHFAKMVVHYWAIPVDDDGDPLIPEDAQDAIFAYCKWKYLVRERGRVTTAAGRNPVALADIDWWHSKWRATYQAFIGQMNVLNARELSEVGENYLYGIPNGFPPILSAGWSKKVS